ncbi:DinB family protein [Nocardioides sp. CN2-186]|uniref:DinB family protein n=1 Tax=Nocardioides tweenelious TaxID=3156607 RepID=UPI0032B5AE4B
MTTTTMTSRDTTTEREDLLALLHKHRDLFRFTVQGLSDEAARSHPTVSALSLGGLIKHVTKVEDNWATFIVEGPGVRPEIDWETVDWSNPPAAVRDHLDSFQMREDETLAELLAAYDVVTEATDTLLANPALDLDHRQPLPAAPWFEPGASWSARRVIVHIIAETAQHAGHADIIRETIDGQKSMG